jgi:hypothetical protein
MMDRLFRKVLIGCAILMLGPQALMLVLDILGDAITRPSPVAQSSTTSSSGFTSGVIVGLAGVVFLAGLLARLGNSVRNRDPHGITRDRRARASQRIRADHVPSYSDSRVIDDDDPPLA